jgi:putative FmdB family regulatory protein
MPIYEYDCPACKKSFEKLVFSSTVVACPDCGARDVVKKLSAFAFKSGGKFTPSSGASCSGCSSSSCSGCGGH